VVLVLYISSLDATRQVQPRRQPSAYNSLWRCRAKTS
jgi:hypothetical protein